MKKLSIKKILVLIFLLIFFFAIFFIINYNKLEHISKQLEFKKELQNEKFRKRSLFLMIKKLIIIYNQQNLARANYKESSNLVGRNLIFFYQSSTKIKNKDLKKFLKILISKKDRKSFKSSFLNLSRNSSTKNLTILAFSSIFFIFFIKNHENFYKKEKIILNFMRFFSFFLKNHENLGKNHENLGKNLKNHENFLNILNLKQINPCIFLESALKFKETIEFQLKKFSFKKKEFLFNINRDENDNIFRLSTIFLNNFEEKLYQILNKASIFYMSLINNLFENLILKLFIEKNLKNSNADANIYPNLLEILTFISSHDNCITFFTKLIQYFGEVSEELLTFLNFYKKIGFIIFKNTNKNIFETHKFQPLLLFLKTNVNKVIKDICEIKFEVFFQLHNNFSHNFGDISSKILINFLDYENLCLNYKFKPSILEIILMSFSKNKSDLIISSFIKNTSAILFKKSSKKLSLTLVKKFLDVYYLENNLSENVISFCRASLNLVSFKSFYLSTYLKLFLEIELTSTKLILPILENLKNCNNANSEKNNFTKINDLQSFNYFKNKNVAPSKSENYKYLIIENINKNIDFQKIKIYLDNR